MSQISVTHLSFPLIMFGKNILLMILTFIGRLAHALTDGLSLGRQSTLGMDFHPITAVAVMFYSFLRDVWQIEVIISAEITGFYSLLTLARSDIVLASFLLLG